MKPIPTHISDVLKATDGEMPPLAPALATATAPYSSSNRRASTSRAYPWLLFTSTSVAALFCLMYITKPVIQTAHSGSPENPMVSKNIPHDAKSVLLTGQDRLPDAKPAGKSSRGAGISAGATPSSFTAFEQTNLRVQHILTAETPGGHLAKIDLDVPVLYQSRNLRWTPAEVAEARGLLTRLTDYQEKSRLLRAEGAELLDSWNRLIEHSIPTGILRADSPTLPTNQQDAADAPRPAGLNTNELIQIQPAGK
jgi:hypothetical protein